MSPRDTYMLGFSLTVAAILIPMLLGIGHALFPGLVAPAAPPLWMVGVFLVGRFISWLARCNTCDLSLIWRYRPDAPRLFRYREMSWLPPKTCSRCGDLLE